jgi:hypothetical protein
MDSSKQTGSAEQPKNLPKGCHLDPENLHIAAENLYDYKHSTNQPVLPSDASEALAKEFFSTHAGQDAGPLAQLCQQKEVCTISEKHSSLGDKEYMAASVIDLAQQNYSIVAFEMINQRDQKLLDGYVSGTVSADKLLTPDTFVAYDYAPGAPEGYLKILDAIKDYNQTTGSQIRPLALEIDYERTDPEMNKRDIAWAKKIDEVLKETPGAKLVTFSGNGHLGLRKCWSTLNRELARLGHASVAIELDSAKPDEIPDDYYKFAAKAVTALGATQPFSYAIKMDKNGEKRADFGYFVPWKEYPHPEIGKDVTPLQEQGDSRTGELNLNSSDPDGKLYVTTDNTGTVTNLVYRGGDVIKQISPLTADENFDFGPNDWILFKYGRESSVRLLRNKDTIATVAIEDGKLIQVRGSKALLYPPLQ